MAVPEGVLSAIRREVRQRRVGLLRIEEVAAAAGMPPEVVGLVVRELEQRGELVVAPEAAVPV